MTSTIFLSSTEAQEGELHLSVLYEQFFTVLHQSSMHSGVEISYRKTTKMTKLIVIVDHEFHACLDIDL